MINNQLLNPQSIAVIGGSDDLTKPGGKILQNIVASFKGAIYVTNLKSPDVQGQKTFSCVEDIPAKVDLAVLAVAAKFCLGAVKTLAIQKGTKAFIIISAGFGEESEEGARVEQEIVDVINSVGGCLIGPNCIGMMNSVHHSVFTAPIPDLQDEGADFISASGATAVFILEAGMPLGLKFNSVYSVGNSAQIGVEDILEYLDETFDYERSSRIKLLYMESIKDAAKLLKHARSLNKKGCRIAAIKAGSSDEGSRAASSHTGAIANPDVAVDALFKKAGIVRCYGRGELATVAAVFMCKELEGKKLAIVTHAGGPAVMLTDALSGGGFNIPTLKGEKASALKEKLYDGSSVANPIDFLATGNAEQLGHIIDACENDFDEIDGMVVIFGSPGLVPVKDVYEMLHHKMQIGSKPIFPVLPSIINVKNDIEYFVSKGNVCFPDEVLFAEALIKVQNRHRDLFETDPIDVVDAIAGIVAQNKDGYLAPEVVSEVLALAGIPFVEEVVVTQEDELENVANKIGFPVVIKVVGPVHKSDVGGVVLDIDNMDRLTKEYQRLMDIQGAQGVLIQPMVSGIELFLGAKYEEGFGHVVLCGLGGIFVEVMGDVSSGLAPLCKQEALGMIKALKGYDILKGVRGVDGVSIDGFVDVIVKFSNMLTYTPEIKEIDINPLMGNRDTIIAVDARIRVAHGWK
ncbi:acetate--CoA ligase family protein [Plebeiibacterium marinum]|uniref:Acetate--CoA ligase family protein n=1 Tax=Plebeiibacterium marinum TaxID=2992111 RepID=A0AAE3MFN6_9BACT|nr:acetate--CoA ligase family protein [Plebeiobacterium marinum]MCW3806566.1 acetate--CoA ligase family protein [Plebeiobacterium marinum]